MSKKILFPGTFDPFTIGHYSVAMRALDMFDEVIIAIGENNAKKTYFSLEKRIEMVKRIFQNNPRVSVLHYDGLTIDIAKETGAVAILRGIRSVADFEYERTVAEANKALAGIETILLFTETKYSFVSSTVVRDLLSHGKTNIAQFLPPTINIEEYI